MLCKPGSLEGGKTATITIAATKQGAVKATASVTAFNVTANANDNETATTTVLGD